MSCTQSATISRLSVFLRLDSLEGQRFPQGKCSKSRIENGAQIPDEVRGGQALLLQLGSLGQREAPLEVAEVLHRQQEPEAAVVQRFWKDEKLGDLLWTKSHGNRSSKYQNFKTNA